MNSHRSTSNCSIDWDYWPTVLVVARVCRWEKDRWPGIGTSLVGQSSRGKTWARVNSYGLTCDANLPHGVEASGKWLGRAIDQALQTGGLKPEQIDLHYKLACGRCALDTREDSVLRERFWFDLPSANCHHADGLCRSNHQPCSMRPPRF